MTCPSERKGGVGKAVARGLSVVLLVAAAPPQVSAASDDVEIVDAGYHTELVRVWRFADTEDRISDLALDGEGALYVGTFGNTLHKIPVDDPQFEAIDGRMRVIDTLPEWPLHLYSTVLQVDLASPGLIFVRELSGVTHMIVPEGEILDTLEANDGLPQYFAVDGRGGFYEAVWPGHEIIKVTDSSEPDWVYEAFSSRVSVLKSNEGFIYAGSAGEVHKIDAETGERVWRYTEPDNFVRAIAVADDGAVIAGSDDQTVHKIAPDGTRQWSYEGHQSMVAAVAVSQDGYVYSGGHDETVHRISPDGENVWTYSGHEDAVHALEVDHAGNLYTGSTDGEVHKLRESPEDAH